MEQNQTPVPVKEPKPRRVGTVTMGLALVAAGGVLLAGQFGLVNALEVLRWSPVILILLGIEILVGSALNKGGKMRYDFLSMIVCFVLISVSVAGSVVIEVVRGVVDGLLAEAAAYGRELAAVMKMIS